MSRIWNFSVCVAVLVATKFNEVVSGRQPRQGVEVFRRFGDHLVSPSSGRYFSILDDPHYCSFVALPHSVYMCLRSGLWIECGRVPLVGCLHQAWHVCLTWRPFFLSDDVKEKIHGTLGHTVYKKPTYGPLSTRMFWKSPGTKKGSHVQSHRQGANRLCWWEPPRRNRTADGNLQQKWIRQPGHPANA